MHYCDFPIKSLTLGDKSYPEELAKIKNPPKTLFVRGKLKRSVLKKTIAIVGSRRMTRYGKDVVDKFVAAFSAEGVTTVSGFMYGVDTEVHQKTLDYGGCTVTVFGCGLDIVYPPENQRLYTEILERGGLALSEYEPNAKPHLWKFPQRNRIVAGLATLGVLIIEAGEKSGSLITAHLARKMDKKVFAVPGAITSTNSQGTNQLIKEGTAKIVTDPSDILGNRRHFARASEDKRAGLSPLEEEIWKALEVEGMSIDELAVHLGKSVVEISQKVTMMSISGKLTESGGKIYLLKK